MPMRSAETTGSMSRLAEIPVASATAPIAWRSTTYATATVPSTTSGAISERKTTATTRAIRASVTPTTRGSQSSMVSICSCRAADEPVRPALAPAGTGAAAM